MAESPKQPGVEDQLHAAATTARAASFGNPDEPPQGVINTKGNPASLTDPGPQNPAIGGQFPSAQFPPPTDVSDMPHFWASFNNAAKRVQDGGWARQVTQADFAIAETISGVDMRLTAGGIREIALAPGRRMGIHVLWQLPDHDPR